MANLITLGLLLATGADGGAGFGRLGGLVEDGTRNAGTTRTVGEGNGTTALAGGRASEGVARHGGGCESLLASKKRWQSGDE